MNSPGPVRVNITGTPINEAFTIRSFEYEERGGAVGDYYYTISFKSYVFLTFKEMTVKKATGTASVAKASTRTDTRVQPNTVTVASGDSLWKIAKRIYGDGEKYPQIATKNNIKAPYIIQPGQVLKV